MPIIRKKLEPAEVYPEDIRYDEDTDTVQRNVNGTWVDAPESDPRHQTTFPPHITADTACDAAQSVVDALKGQIDDILVAIDNAATVFTIAGLILGLFTFGVFEIFIAIALGIGNAMLDAGTSALSAALTDPVYHQLVCILSCHMDSSGRLAEGELAVVETEVTADIGGLAATILNSMLSLAGEGGINNLAALGESDGDCDDCGCEGACGEDWIITGGEFNSAPSESTIVYASTEDIGTPGRQSIVVTNLIANGGTGTCCYLPSFTILGATVVFFTVFCDGSSGFASPQGECIQAFAVWNDSNIPFTATAVWSNCP